MQQLRLPLLSFCPSSTLLNAHARAMVHFPHEILLHIVADIADSSTPRSEVRLHLARLCRTSRAWHAAARAELYSSLTLFIDDDYDTAPDAKLVRTLLLSDEHAAFVRTLTLIWRASDVERTAVVVGLYYNDLSLWSSWQSPYRTCP